jgi:hypothetical protein
MGHPSHILSRILITKIPLFSVSARSCFLPPNGPSFSFPVERCMAGPSSQRREEPEMSLPCKTREPRAAASLNGMDFEELWQPTRQLKYLAESPPSF